MSLELTASAMVCLMESGSIRRGRAGDAKKASRTALVDHSVMAGGQKRTSREEPTLSVISSSFLSVLTMRSGSVGAMLELIWPRSLSLMAFVLLSRKTCR